MESKKFKSVSLTTKNKEDWERAMQAFIEITSEMIKKNEIGI
jgi:biotin synthase-related radical SAM superfamily protein